MPKMKNPLKPKKKQKLTQQYNIVGKTRAFDQNLFEKYDTIAREFVKNKLGEFVMDNPNMYGEDMLFICDALPYKYIELQVYASWTKNAFPYACPYIYARKMKFDDDTLFISFNKDMTQIIMFPKKAISTMAYRLKKYDREMVYYIPWCKTMKIDADDLSLNVIKLYNGVDIDDDIENNNDIENNTEQQIILINDEEQK